MAIWSSTFADALDEFLASGRGGLEHVGGDVAALGLVALVSGEEPPAHLDQVDAAVELGLDADRDLDRHGVRAKPVDHHVDRALEVRADAVHLVDEADAGNAVAVGLAPHGFGLRFDAGDGVEDRQRHRPGHEDCAPPRR